MNSFNEFVDFVLPILLGDNPDEIVFVCQPQRVEIRERIGNTWHSTLPITREFGEARFGSGFGAKILKSFKKNADGIEVSVPSKEKNVTVRLQIEIHEDNVCLRPEWPR